MNYKTIWFTLRQTFSAWNEHDAPGLGAALAFYYDLVISAASNSSYCHSCDSFRTFHGPGPTARASREHGRPPGIGGCEGNDRTGSKACIRRARIAYRWDHLAVWSLRCVRRAPMGAE